MAITRINNNQITDSVAGNLFLGVNAAVKIQDFSVTAGKIANNLTYNSDLTVTGNLTVQGNTTAIDTINLVVEDPLILLAKEQTGAPALDIGFIGKRGTEDNIAFVWDESADQFVAVFTTSEVTNSVININSYASLQVLDLTAANANITGNVTFSGNIVGNVTVTGNVDANNFNASSAVTAGTTISATGNVSGGNVTTAGVVEATGNVSGGNVTTAGNVNGGNINATANVTGQGAVFSGNVTADTFIGNISGNIDAGGANTSIQFNDDDVLAGSTAFTFDKTSNLVTASGNISAGNLVTGGVVEATGNVIGGNITTAGVVQATGNVIGGNITTAGNVDGGNVNAVTNVTATTVTASGNVDAGTAVNANLIAGTSVQINSTGDIVLNPTGNINVSGVRVRNMSDPQLAFDAATKQYVDDAVSAGIHVHPPVDVETTAPLTTVTYANGGNVFTVNETIAGNVVVFTTAANLQVNDQLWFDNSFNGVVGNLAYFVVSTPNTSAAVLTTAYNGVPVSNITSGSGLSESVRVNSGVGATLTATANGAITVDGVSLSAGNRVLVNDQLNQIENGVYAVTDAGNINAPYILTRSSDADTYEPQTSDGLDQGSYFYVESGDVGAGASYVKTAPSGPFIFGVANIVFTQFSASQVYSANTQAGLVLNGTVFSAKVDNDTTAFDGGGNIIVKTGANLVTPNIGNATGNSLTLTGNANVANLNASAAVIATGNVSGGNLTTVGVVTATGNVSGGNITTAGVVDATGNVTGGNVNTIGVVAATGNVSGGNLTTVGVVAATGNVSGGNITTAGVVEATGNVSGGNLTTAGLVSATGNVTGGNLTTAGVVAATGNVSGGNLTTAGVVAATGNVSGGNIVTTGTADLGNIRITGNDITNFASNVITINAAASDIDVRISGDNQANLLVTDAGTDTVLVGGGNATVGASFKVDTTDSMMPPVGNTLQRPGTPQIGMFRFNTGGDALEVYTSGGWEDVGVPEFTVIVADAFVGNGVQTIFTLSQDSTTAGTIVAINGIVQEPTTAYAVSGNVLTFTEAPAVSDNIDARILTTTTTVTGIENTSGNAVIEVLDSADTVQITGNLLPLTSNVYNLGSGSKRWNELFLEGSTITLGNVVIKNTSGNTIGFFGPDGTTAGSIDTNNIDSAGISNGTSSVQVITSGGNVRTNIAGATIQTISSTGVEITGDLSVTGNATLSGNILGDRIQNGTTQIDIQVPNGNANITVGGTSNVAVFSTGGANITGYLTATGNVTGNFILGNGSQLTGIDATSIQNGTANVRTFLNGNVTVSAAGTANVMIVTNTGANITGTLNATGNANVGNLGTAGLITATGNITGGNLITAGLVSLASITKTGSNGVGNIGSSTSVFDTVFAKATSAQYADLAEMYEADAVYESGTVLCFGGTREVTLCGQTDSTRVAGVVSTNPSYLMNSGQTGEHVAAVALTGRVPCRVTGTIRKGDLIVSTGDGRGRANNAAAVGTVIGKALADFDGTDGVIEVVVGRV